MFDLLHSSPILAFGMPGPTEWIVILLIGLLIFGRRLPEVGRSLGKSIVEFKKGIKGIEDDIEAESTASTARLADRPAPPAPRVRETEPSNASSGAGDRPAT
ncbi:MAG: twin-arginine translocase TatA/TatE family subunit [Phycisphaerales bacterium]